MQKICKFILRIFGWRVEITAPDYPKCLICVAPHTSNWDFILGELAIRSVGRAAGFLMKETWFFWPMGIFFRAIGGIPVPRKRGGSLTDAIIAKYNSSPRLTLAITPEGTRKATNNWRHGFLHIAMQADIPLLLGILDFKQKLIRVSDQFIPTGNIESDLNAIKDFYAPYQGKYPHKFDASHD